MAKWDWSKLEWHGPLPDDWFNERAQMQERIEELEAKMAKAEHVWLRLALFADQAGGNFLSEKAREALAELKGNK